MSNDRTQIEWTDSTWNPVRGCSRVSAGCHHCYAEPQAARIIRMDRGRGVPVGQGAYDGLLNEQDQWNGKIKLVEDQLKQPLRWKKPRKIFVNSMSDLFHKGVPEDFIDKVFAVAALCFIKQETPHTFQILTKRPDRMSKYLNHPDTLANIKKAMRELDHQLNNSIDVTPWWPLPNVWLGVSVEDNKSAKKRIPLLLECPAVIRWISAEPLLGYVDLQIQDTPKIHWVVVGGESGKDARPMHRSWLTDLLWQCQEHNIPFLFKQWGEWNPRMVGGGDGPCVEDVPRIRLTDQSDNGSILGAKGDNDSWMNRSGKARAGRMLGGQTYDEYPVVPPIDQLIAKGVVS